MSARIEDALAAAATALEHGDTDHALGLCAEVLGKQPRNRAALRLRGYAQLARGDAAGAVLTFTQAQKGPPDPELSEYLGLAHLAAGAPDRAVAELRRAVKLGARSASVHARLAAALAAQQQFAQAEDALRTALARAPGDGALVMQLAAAQAAQGKLAEALESYAAVPASDPAAPDARFNGAVLLERRGDTAAAIAQYRALLADVPGYADAHNNLGVLYERAGDLAAARAAYEAALAVSARHVAAHANLGKVLRTQGELANAETHCRRALALEPDHAVALTNLGNVLAARDDVDGALVAFRQALAAEPDNADAALSAGMLELARGRWAAGWAGYRARPTRLAAVAAGVPLCTTLPAAGHPLLLLAEQGLGDELFFLRFAPAARERGVRLHCRCDPRLAGMLRRTGEFESVSAMGTMPDDGVPVMLVGDLPGALEDRDACPPPLRLAPLAERLAHLRGVLAAFGPPPYVGLTWRAGTARGLQQADRPVLFKELPLAPLAAMMRSLPARYVVLQRAPLDGEVEALRELSGSDVLDLSALNAELEDMLAVLALLDDYVAVSNTNVHLRAGLAAGARVLVPHPPEWRWLRAGSASPWFPGMAVYRQTDAGDWLQALDRLAAEWHADLKPAPE